MIFWLKPSGGKSSCLLRPLFSLGVLYVLKWSLRLDFVWTSLALLTLCGRACPCLAFEDSRGNPPTAGNKSDKGREGEDFQKHFTGQPAAERESHLCTGRSPIGLPFLLHPLGPTLPGHSPHTLRPFF